MINVLIADDHISLQQSLVHLLESAEDIHVVGTALNGVEAVNEADRHRPDVTVMDISMPVMDGIEATQHIQQRCRCTSVVILSIYDHPMYVKRALEAGADGYVLKDAVGQDLLAAIRALAEGEQYFSARVAAYAGQDPDRHSHKNELKETGD